MIWLYWELIRENRIVIRDFRAFFVKLPFHQALAKMLGLAKHSFDVRLQKPKIIILFIYFDIFWKRPNMSMYLGHATGADLPPPD